MKRQRKFQLIKMVPSRVISQHYFTIILYIIFVIHSKMQQYKLLFILKKKKLPCVQDMYFFYVNAYLIWFLPRNGLFFLNLYSRLFYFVGYFLSFFVFYNCCSILTFQNLTLALYKHFRCKSRLYLLKVFNETFSPTLKKNKLRNAFLNQSALMSSFLSVYLSGIFLLSAFACMQ